MLIIFGITYFILEHEQGGDLTPYMIIHSHISIKLEC